VLIGFFTAVAPLCLAILFTVQALEELSSSQLALTRQVIEVTRQGQQIEAELRELERHIRQYLTLFDPELARLAEEERSHLQQQLNELRARVGDPGLDTTGLANSLKNLDLAQIDLPESTTEPPDTTPYAKYMEDAFEVIKEQRSNLSVWLQNWVDQLLEANAAQTEAVIHSMLMQLSFLAAGTLALLLLFSYWINKPVQDLSKEIDKLGTTGLSHIIKISGPEEVAELGRKLEWLRKRLHEFDQQKAQFQRHISHELKTPLASLREGTDLLAEQVTGHLSQQQREVVYIIRQNAIELQRMIENLVEYNQLPQQELVFEEIELVNLWQEILSNYLITISQKGLALKVRHKVDRWVADRHKLKTTVDNLLSNAVNYTPEGGEIEVVWRSRSANLIVEVANSGDPIPPADSERVFEPFYQSTAKRTGPIKGSGVGLSVARECIELQGGTLTLVPHKKFPVGFRLICPAH
jgi:two-component system sensor histidine kinase GlrK